MTRRQISYTALFSAKCCLSAMLAYYIALRIGLTRPFWAVTTSYIVAQPMAGAVLSKAAFRVMGTVLGAGAALVLVPNLVDAPELLSLGLALWLGLCLYISLHDRTPRSYVFLLAGYTASIIGFPSVSSPGAVFDIASVRVQEIVIGILCSCVVHAAILPSTVTDTLFARIDKILTDVERWSRDSLVCAPNPALDRDRRRLALDINELHQLSIHLPFDTARLLPRVQTVRALQAQLSLLLPLSSAADDRLSALQVDGGVPATVNALIARVCDWLDSEPGTPADRAIATERLIADARGLEPDISHEGKSAKAWHDALLVSLLARVADLVAAHHAIRDLRDQIRAPGRAPISPLVAAALRQAGRRVFHRDSSAALRAAAGAVVAILIGCTFWIGTAWADGAGAVLMAGVCCALFASSNDPAPAVRTFFYGSMAGVGVAGIYAYLILPRVTDFVPLAILLAPVFLVAGALLVFPRWNLFALGWLVGFINNAGLADRYDDNFQTFLNGGIAQLAGTLFAVSAVALFQSVGAEQRAGRLIRAGWRDLAQRSNSRRAPDIAGWNSRMLDRVALLAPQLAAQGQDPGKPVFDALADLRVGITVGELRRLREAATAREDAMITPVLLGVSSHYAKRRADTPAPAGEALLASIDDALTGFVRQSRVEGRRDTLLALVGLRRNLFPAAPGYGERLAA